MNFTNIYALEKIEMKMWQRDTYTDERWSLVCVATVRMF